jgi:hypothetical protein
LLNPSSKLNQIELDGRMDTLILLPITIQHKELHVGGYPLRKVGIQS